MPQFPLSWIVHDRAVFHHFCCSIHRRKQLTRILKKKHFSRWIEADFFWIFEDETLFKRLLNACERIKKIVVQRLIKGRREKPNEATYSNVLTSNYKFRKEYHWFRKRLA